MKSQTELLRHSAITLECSYVRWLLVWRESRRINYRQMNLFSASLATGRNLRRKSMQKSEPLWKMPCKDFQKTRSSGLAYRLFTQMKITFVSTNFPTHSIDA